MDAAFPFHGEGGRKVIGNVMHEGECFMGNKDTVQGVSRAYEFNSNFVCVIGDSLE